MGTAEGEDKVVEAGAGARSEDEAEFFITTPDSFNSRTIASTMALSWVSSIKNFSGYMRFDYAAEYSGSAQREG